MSPASAASFLLPYSASPFSLSADSALSVPAARDLMTEMQPEVYSIEVSDTIHSREVVCRKTVPSHPRQQRCSGAAEETASPSCLSVPIAPSAKPFQDSVPDH